MKNFSFSRMMFWAGLVFLYAPMFILVIYSFNESRLVTVWVGWSVKWYGELFQDTQIMSAVKRSLEVAFMSATAAVFFGMLSSWTMVRIAKFRGKTLFGGMITAPLVMPDVIIGLSLLLLFVAFTQLTGWPKERGLLTIWIAHTTFGMAYATVVISSRLREMDASIEEAAMDLGAPPLKVFFAITLPLIAPAVASAWLLAFTLSLDDVVIASFVTGPGATTLPIEVLSSVRRGVSPKINVLATLIILAVSVVTFAVWYVSRRIEKNRKKAMAEDFLLD